MEIVTFAEIQKVKWSFEFKNLISSTRNCNEFRLFEPRFTSLIPIYNTQFTLYSCNICFWVIQNLFMNYFVSSSNFQIPTQCAVITASKWSQINNALYCMRFIWNNKVKNCIVSSAEIYMLCKEIIFQTAEKLQGISCKGMIVQRRWPFTDTYSWNRPSWQNVFLMHWVCL